MKKLKNALLALLFVLILAPSTLVKADGESAEQLLNVALSQKTFYHYNIAYAKIIQESDADKQSELLSKLSTITDVVWTSEIKNLNSLIDEMAKTKSGRAYDEIGALIANSTTLKQVDKDYLSYELYSWGTNLVYTPDYKAAVDAVVTAWNTRTEESIQKAKDLASKVQVTINKEYLLGEISKIKVLTGTRTNPIALKNNAQFNLQSYSWNKPKVVELQLANITRGDDASNIVYAENQFNKEPGSDEEWIVMKFNLKYVSGPEEELRAADVISTYSSFYITEGTKVAALSTATFSNEYKGQGIYDVSLYPGSKSTFYVGILVKKSTDYPLIRIGTGYDDAKYETTYTWFTTNPN